MGWDVQKSNLSTCSASYIPLHIIVPRILRNETERETEAHRGSNSHPRSHCTLVVCSRFELKSIHFKSLSEGWVRHVYTIGIFPFSYCRSRGN